MTDRFDCEPTQLLLAELAAGAATGHDRARVLTHLAGCAACRNEMTQLSRAADTLLLLAPRVEPPPGFETKVIAALEADTAIAGHPLAADRQPRLAWPRRLGRRLAEWRRGSEERSTTSGRRSRFPRPVRVAVIGLAMLVSLAGGAAVTQWRGAEDRKLAEHYRQTLDLADGRFLDAVRLAAPDGSPAGTVFLYQGNPSWLMVTVTAAPADGPYKMLLVERDGSLVPSGICRITDGAGTAGYRLPVPVDRIAEIQLHAPTPTSFHLTARI